MWEQIGKAEVDVRVRPWKDAELRDYLVWEYGPGNEPAALLREVSRAGESPWVLVRRAFAWVVRAVAGSSEVRVETRERASE